MSFVRFQATELNDRGLYMGVFGLIGRLSGQGLLTEEQERFRREHNAWYDAAYPTPSDVDPAVYDPEVNPQAVAWFKVTAQELIARVDGYLEILSLHGVGCERVESALPPGRIIYEDEHQIVVVPHHQADEASDRTSQHEHEGGAACS